MLLIQVDDLGGNTAYVNLDRIIQITGNDKVTIFEDAEGRWVLSEPVGLVIAAIDHHRVCGNKSAIVIVE